jgi:hypothetical protein
MQTLDGMLSLYIRAYWVDKANHRRFTDAAVGQITSCHVA